MMKNELETMTITLTREEAQQVLDALNSCGEDWVADGEWETRVDDYDHELVAKAIELLRARLAQPEPEPVAKMREMLEVQGRDGTWNYSPYLRGMYNGMEFMLALVEDREPVYRDEPDKYYTAPQQREWHGLTHEEIAEESGAAKAQNHMILTLSEGFFCGARWAEAKLKEKNFG